MRLYGRGEPPEVWLWGELWEDEKESEEAEETEESEECLQHALYVDVFSSYASSDSFVSSNSSESLTKQVSFAMMKVLFVGGGSIGHLSPSLAVWESMRDKHSGMSELFACGARRDDLKFLKSGGVSRVPIFTAKLNSIFFIFLFPLALLESLFILLWFRPNVIFSKGGYVSVPPCIVGWILRHPIVLHESDRVMGKANKFLLRFARHLCIGTPQKEIANNDVMTKIGIAITATGNPIRRGLLTGSDDGGRRVTEFSGKRPVLLVVGGSQGAHILNEAVWNTLSELIDICDIVHLTGRGKMNAGKTHGRYFQREVVYDELNHLYALADVVISRAGAGAIAELSALGKATILVPIPGLASNHQEENAHFLEVAHAAVVLEQNTLDTTLVPTVRNLMQDESKRRNLGERLYGFSDPDAADRIANILLASARN